MIRRQTCAICGQELETDAPSRSPLFPFCSERCKMIDLYRWCEGKYAIVENLDPEQIDEQTGDEPGYP